MTERTVTIADSKKVLPSLVVQIWIDHVHDGNQNFLPLNQRDLFASKNTLQEKKHC